MRRSRLRRCRILQGGQAAPGKELVVSVTSPVSPSVRLAGARRRASRVGGLVAAACIGPATVPMALAAARVLYFEVPRAAAPPGWPGAGVTGPAGNPVVSACHGDLRYDVPGECGRAGTAIASFQASVAGDFHISATPGAGAGGTAAAGGDVLWYAVAHIAGAGVVFLVRAGTGTALIIITAVRCEQGHAMTASRTLRADGPRRGRMAPGNLEVSGDDGQGYGCSPAAAK